MNKKSEHFGGVYSKLFIKVGTNLSIHLSVCPYICPSVHTSVHTSVRLSIHLSVCPYFFLCKCYSSKGLINTDETLHSYIAGVCGRIMLVQNIFRGDNWTYGSLSNSVGRGILLWFYSKVLVIKCIVLFL